MTDLTDIRWTQNNALRSTGAITSKDGTYCLDCTTTTVGTSRSDYPNLDLGDLFDGSSSWTVECFIYRPTTAALNILGIGDNSTSDDNYVAVYEQTTSFHRLYNDSNSEFNLTSIDSSTTAINTWYHIGMSYDHETKTVYMLCNGTVASGTRSIALELTDAKLYVGCRGDTNNTNLTNAYFDNLRVSNTVLYTASYSIPDPTVDDWSGTDATTVFYDNFEGTADLIDTRWTQGNTLRTANITANKGTYCLDCTATTVGTLQVNHPFIDLSSLIDMGTSSWTVECFVNHATLSNSVLLGIGDTTTNDDNYASLYSAENNSEMNSKSGGSLETSQLTITLTANSWYHIGMSYDVSTKSLYMICNGQVNTEIRSTELALTDAKLYIGCRGDGYSDAEASDTYIDNLRVSNTALYTTATYTVPDPEADGWSETDATTVFYDNFETEIKMATDTSSLSVYVSSTADPTTLSYNINSGTDVEAGNTPYTIYVSPADEVAITLSADGYPDTTTTVTVPAASKTNMSSLYDAIRDADNTVDLDDLPSTTKTTLLANIDTYFETGELVKVDGSTGLVVNASENVTISSISSANFIIASSMASGDTAAALMPSGDTITIKGTDNTNEFIIGDGTAKLDADTSIKTGGYVLSLKAL